MPNKSLLDMNMKDLQIIYKNNKPYGIRDKCGYLLFFCEIQKWTGQEERYRQEIEDQFKLADYLLSALKKKSNHANALDSAQKAAHHK